MVTLVLLIDVSPSNSFQISTISPTASSASTLRNKCLSTTPPQPQPQPQPISSSIILRSAQDTNEQDDGDGDVNLGGDGSLDLGGILGTIASIVVLRSEFILKTTGCGLPAGPFGLVGAIEGVSYLGVVATCATAAVGYFSEDGLEGSDSITRRLAITLSVSAVVVGVAVLAFQLTDYGFIPNAVPMKGGMCK